MSILKAFSLILVFIVTFLFFLPKQNIYFFLENELSKHEIIISDEKFTSSLTNFEFVDANLYIKGVNIALLNKVNLSLDGLNISSKEIGNVSTSFDIDTRSIVIDFNPTKVFIKDYKTVLKQFKKEKNGKYRYEYVLF